MIRPPRVSTLFPYTTLFRSPRHRGASATQRRGSARDPRPRDPRRPRELPRSEEHTSELQSPDHLVCRLLLEKKNPRPLTPEEPTSELQSRSHLSRPLLIKTN